MGVAGDSYTCTFTATINSGVAVTHTDTVTVFAIDQSTAMNSIQDSDSATIMITDVAPTAMVTKAVDDINCVNVTYDVDVENTSSAESLSVTALTDNSYGSITSVQGDVTATNCSVPQTLQPAGAANNADTYSCSFDASFCGTQHTNKVTATVEDNDGNSIMENSADVTVKVGFVP